ncbi:MAG: ABC transporter ATP-binding protein [Thermoleophilia bacterium]|jgi:putative spermidine/putrescine transport system ATP-binding protein|nr:ABC transporter ATP-binding protein [Thermoleophilia bacterium]
MSNEERAVPTKGALSLRRVTKLYGDLRAVDDVSLDVAPGEFVTLLGPSGSGKTTTLRIIGGFIRPDEGTVVLDGRDLTKVQPYKRDIGMVFQNYALFPHMTAAENVGFPLSMRRVPKAQIKERVRDALALVRLEQLGDRYPKQLSGGQQQRVALARSFSFNPQLLLMDEPLGALDKKLREALQLEVIRISRQLAVTVVYVTHDQEESLVMSDRIAIYNEGRIEQIGSGEDLYERPVSLFVADFVGESNIYRGTLQAEPFPCIALAEGPPVRVPSHAGERVGLSPGDRAAVVIRPERMNIRQGGAHDVPEPDEATVARLSGRLRELIYLGSDRKYVVDVEGGATAVIRVQAGTEGADAVVGPEVTVSWAVDDSVVVTESGARAGSDGPLAAEAAPHA